MVFFMIQLALMILGAIVHIVVDRSASRRTTGRAAELVLLWILVPAGVFGIFAGVGHIGPRRARDRQGHRSRLHPPPCSSGNSAGTTSPWDCCAS